MERGRDTGFSSREVTPRDTGGRGEGEESEYSDTEEGDTEDEEGDTEEEDTEEEDGGVVRSNKTPFVLLKQLVGIMKMAPPRTIPAAGEAKETEAGAGASLKDGEDKKGAGDRDVSVAGGGEVNGEDGHSSTMNGHDSPDPGTQEERQGGAQDKPDLNGV